MCVCEIKSVCSTQSYLGLILSAYKPSKKPVWPHYSITNTSIAYTPFLHGLGAVGLPIFFLSFFLNTSKKIQYSVYDRKFEWGGVGGGHMLHSVTSFLQGVSCMPTHDRK